MNNATNQVEFLTARGSSIVFAIVPVASRPSRPWDLSCTINGAVQTDLDVVAHAVHGLAITARGSILIPVPVAVRAPVQAIWHHYITDGAAPACTNRGWQTDSRLGFAE